MALATNSFVEFPERPELLARMRSIEVYEEQMEPMFRLVADRLESKAYDRSAFVFILLELIYEFEQDAISFSDLLGRLVFALTDDLDLVGEALEAFSEIRMTLEPEAAEPDLPESDPSDEMDDAPADEPLPPPPEEEIWDPVADQEHLMLELQLAQKKVADFGLGTRASIEQALARPTRANAGQTLRQISNLRSSLLHFEELLRESEERILEAIGVFDKE